MPDSSLPFEFSYCRRLRIRIRITNDHEHNHLERCGAPTRPSEHRDVDDAPSPLLIIGITPVDRFITPGENYRLTATFF
jgi:hypothetical protein